MTVLAKHKFFAAAFLAANFAGFAFPSFAASKDNPSKYWRGGYFGPAFSLYKLNNTYTPTVPLGVRNLKARGKLVGLIGGYNFLHKSVMMGVEADISSGSVFKNNLSYLTTLRGRIGKPFHTSMPFLTGGVALARLKKTPATSPFRVSHIQPGLVAGGGFEQILAQAITGRLEYTYGRFFTNNSPGKNTRLNNIHMFRASIAIHLRD